MVADIERLIEENCEMKIEVRKLQMTQLANSEELQEQEEKEKEEFKAEIEGMKEEMMVEWKKKRAIKRHLC